MIAVAFLFTLIANTAAGTVKLNDLDQGSVFSKCIKIADYQDKGPGDEVETAERDETTSCCPDGFTHGSTATSSTYSGAPFFYIYGMISCGWADDGTVKGISTGSACDYGTCYVAKQAVTCADDSAMTNNGCCSGDGGFGSTTSFPYCTSASSSSNGVSSCYTYQTDKDGWVYVGTKEAKDDFTDGKMNFDKIYQYGQCGTSGGGDDDEVDFAAPAAVMGPAVLAAMLVAALFM